MRISVLVLILSLFYSCDGQPIAPVSKTPSQPQLHRISYVSGLDLKERNFYLFLPTGYFDDDTTKWPVLMHLHGNGERGDGKEDLKWVTKHGPLMEAWVQKRDIPFIIIVPQLQMMGMDTLYSYIAKRDSNTIPKRIENGVPPRVPEDKATIVSVKESETVELPYDEKGRPLGWYLVEEDLKLIIDKVKEEYRVDAKKTFLTGLSIGAYGSWYIGSRNPDYFAAIVPVAGWGHPKIMDEIVNHNTPVWCFAGALDQVVPLEYFKPGISRLEELGYTNFTFTVIDDVGHDVWKRVYKSDEIYNWLLNLKR